METYNMQLKASISIFLLLSVFYNMFMLYWSLRARSILILNIAYFLTLFVRKNSSLFLSYLDRAMKKVKSLKIENFDQISEMPTYRKGGQF